MPGGTKVQSLVPEGTAEGEGSFPASTEAQTQQGVTQRGCQPDTSSCQARSCLAQQLLLGTSQGAYQLLRHPNLPLWLLGSRTTRAPSTLAHLGLPPRVSVSQLQPCVPGVASLQCGGTAEMHNPSSKAGEGLTKARQ